jgi:hypothetical protein
MLKEDEEEVRIAIENNEYVANSHVKELLGQLPPAQGWWLVSSISAPTIG